METIETPASRFEELPDFPYEPHYVEVDSRGLHMAYVDEGPRSAPVVLMLHGEPSWSFLYRFMIPPCLDAGLRVVAPDLIGFGRSDKLVRVVDYSYQAHCDWVQALIERLDLREMTLFGQDWGALIGLRLAAELEPRFGAVVIGNGYLPTGSLPVHKPAAIPGIAAFLTWRTFARWSPVFPPGRIVDIGTRRKLREDERKAYDAPFPDARSLAGARAFPLLVPLGPRDPAAAPNRAAWRVLEQWNKPFVTTFSTGDPITRGLDRVLQRRVPGAASRTHHRVDGGHFLQEDASPELADIIVQTTREITDRRESRAPGPS